MCAQCLEDGELLQGRKDFCLAVHKSHPAVTKKEKTSELSLVVSSLVGQTEGSVFYVKKKK